MEWLNRLKMTSVKKSIPALLLFVAAAVVILLVSKCYGVFGMLTPKTFDQLTPDHLNGVFVDDDIDFIYDYYVEETQTKNGRYVGIVGRQYIIDMDDEYYYMGLYAHQGALKDANEMMEACWDAADGELAPADLPVYHVRGLIREMTEEDLSYYREYTSDLGMDDAFLPYYLEIDYINNVPIVLSVILLLVVFLLVGLGVWRIVKALTGGFQKQVRAKLSESGDLEVEAEKAERFYESAPETSGVKMDRNYVFFQNGAESILLRPWDVAWAYQSTTQHRRNGIPTGKTYAAILRTMDGKQYTLGMAEAAVQTLLETMSTALPGVVLGYDEELARLYKNNRNAFRQRWEEKMPELGQSQRFSGGGSL